MYFWPERKKLRFSNYDYSRNWFYFITICTKNRENYFGEIIDEKMILNEYGKIVENEILKTEGLRKEIKIDIFVIMPNHIHLIIIIENNLKNEINNIVWNNHIAIPHKTTHIVGCDCIAPIKTWPIITRTGTMQSFPTGWWFDINGARWLKWNHLSSIIRWLKSSITKQINDSQNDFQFSWQKSFYDVVIKNDDQLEKTRQYILDNPLKWEDDINNISK